MVALMDTYSGCYMATTAENLARKHGITREAQDEFALRSQKLAAAAWSAGRVQEEITSVELVTRSIDRKSTRLNSSHVSISYAVFCLKKKCSSFSLPP